MASLAIGLWAFSFLIVLELLASSIYWLHFRHTRIEAHAVETTASFRERLLIPRHLEASDQQVTHV